MDRIDRELVRNGRPHLDVDAVAASPGRARNAPAIGAHACAWGRQAERRFGVLALQLLEVLLVDDDGLDLEVVTAGFLVGYQLIAAATQGSWG